MGLKKNKNPNQLYFAIEENDDLCLNHKWVYSPMPDDLTNPRWYYQWMPQVHCVKCGYRRDTLKRN